MNGLETPTWPQLAMTNVYRNAGPAQQWDLKRLWMKRIAPQLYSGILGDREAFRSLYNFVEGYQPPPVLPDEDVIVTPESAASMNSFRMLESNPLFAKRDLREQQAYRNLWYHKMSVSDPEFQQLPAEDQQAFYQNLMTRAPALSTTFAQKALFPGYTPDEFAKRFEDKTEAGQALMAASGNLATAFTTSFGGLILGPLRLALGEDSGLARALEDNQRVLDWVNSQTQEHSNFLLRTLPTIVGFGAGLLTGPFIPLEKVLAGTIKGATTIGKIVQAPGVLQKVGTTLGMKIPDIAYQVAGGTIAGGLQGIGEALTEGKDWKTYLTRDMTIGVAGEFIGRYIGMLRAVRKAAVEVGIEGGRAAALLSAPFEVGTGKVLSPELDLIMRTHPDIAPFIKAAQTTDIRGFVVGPQESLTRLKMHTDLMGLTVESTPDALRIRDKAGRFVKRFEGLENTRIKSAMDWVVVSDYADDIWDQTIFKKKPGELLGMSARDLEVRVGHFVPEAGRRNLLQHFKKHKIDAGLDFTLDPRGDTALIDEYYSLFRTQTPAKINAALDARGIRFFENSKENTAVIKQIKGELDELSPNSAYYMVNKETGKIMFADSVPQNFFEHPDLKQPFMFQQVYTGSPTEIRKTLTTIRKNYANEKRAITRLAKSQNMDVQRYIDNQMVEVNFRIPDAKGHVHEMAIHFPSLKYAQETFTAGKFKGVKGISNNFFQDDQKLKKAMERFRKNMYKTNRELYEQDFIPFRFVSKMADQEGFYLGTLNGKYIIQDVLDDVGREVKYWSFNNLDDTVSFLRKQDGRRLIPNAVKEIKQEAMEEIYPRSLNDLREELTYETVRRTKKFGVREVLPFYTAPSQYATARLGQFEIVQELQERGYKQFDPVHYWNDIRDMTRSQADWTTKRATWVNKLSKGVNKEESGFMFRWMQGVQPEELANPKMKGLQYELADAIEEEMVDAFGRQRTDVLLSRASQLSDMFDELFAGSGMNAATYIKHYHPHMAAEIEKLGAGPGSRIDAKKITQVPDADKKFFFELLREVDPKDVLWETDVFKVMNTYIHLMGRKMIVRPVIKRIGNDFRRITRELGREGIIPKDYEVIVNYYAKLFESIEGIQAPSARIMRHATDTSLQGIADAVNARFGTHYKMKGKHDLVAGAITLSTGAHLAARPMPVFRNLTQSLITGGSTIGTRWWLEGVEKGLHPGSLRRMQDLGISIKGQIPVGAGAEILQGGALGTAVRKGMVPYKWADSVNRSIVYHGMEARIESAIDLYRKGKISRRKFDRLSGAKLFGMSEYNEGLKYLHATKNADEGFRAFKDHYSRLAVDRTQYLYNAFDQPQAFRSGVARFFGQYTSWPLNFYNLIKERMLTDSISVPQKIGFAARLAGSTFAISSALYEAGISADKFAPWNMVMLQGGPYYQMMNDALGMLNGDRTGMQGLMRSLSSLVPFSYEGEGILMAVQAFQEGEFYEGVMHLMSMPLRTDIYPRRDVITTDIEKWLVEAGTKFLSLREREFSAQGLTQ